MMILMSLALLLLPILIGLLVIPGLIIIDIMRSHSMTFFRIIARKQGILKHTIFSVEESHS